MYLRGCGHGKGADTLKKIAAAVCFITLALVLAGCMSASADDLYTLPELSEGYLQLQGVIDSVLGSGAEYAAPTDGSNRQPVQQEDIDGDGVREALAFFNFTGSDRPLKIFIFRNDGDEYTEIARIEGEGTSIDSVSYLDMDGDGVRELAVGWQMGPGINMLSVYSLKGYQINQIINTNYTEYTVCDLNGDSDGDILVLRLSSSELTGEAEFYTLLADGEVERSTARLSQGTERLLRVRGTGLTDGRRAVLVESTVGGSGVITDIFAYRSSKLRNITLDEAAGISTETRRASAVYCRDIDGDGILEVPSLVPLPSTSESTQYYMTEWYSYSSYGRKDLAARTYNNYTDAWWLIIPEEWVGRIAVRREEGMVGERMIVFSLVGADGAIGRDFLKIYTLTGENREERAASGGRFVLAEEEETICSASILVNEGSFELPISRSLIRDNFGFIYSEWSTGEI